MFVLDTNVVSELRKTASGRADANVVSWASSASAGAMYVSAMTMFELELGILMMERRDPAQGGILRNWMTLHVLPAFAGRVLAIDSAVAFQCAKLHMPNQRSERDAMIAATALVHGMSVVTRNLDDFQGTGATLINPWLP
jgi:predicted nucleic acid-binding protein